MLPVGKALRRKGISDMCPHWVRTEGGKIETILPGKGLRDLEASTWNTWQRAHQLDMTLPAPYPLPAPAPHPHAPRLVRRLLMRVVSATGNQISAMTHCWVMSMLHMFRMWYMAFIFCTLMAQECQLAAASCRRL